MNLPLGTDIGVELKCNILDPGAFDEFVKRRGMPPHTGEPVSLPGVPKIFGMLYEDEVRVAVAEAAEGVVVVASRCVGSEVYRDLSVCVTGAVPDNTVDMVARCTGLRVSLNRRVVRLSLPDNVVACLPTRTHGRWLKFDVGKATVVGSRPSDWHCVVSNDCNAFIRDLACYIDEKMRASCDN